ncbi:hypothetical protein [Clostridium rectalis]|uniref:hypothetical protein n=1 Tax=Clostridium rectalis TaxID=2040295 RepID=UPI000F630B4B|nr:hypothetical protein [Clostridium rectalis]
MALKDNITVGISRIAKTVGDGAATVAKKSGEIVEVSKLNIRISSNKNRMESLYKDIGELVFKKYENGEIIDKDLEDNCKEISVLNEENSKLEEKVSIIKNKDEEDTEEDYIE